jgi:ubiquinol-cytochrome c reductase iron-sulfur subunit
LHLCVIVPQDPQNSTLYFTRRIERRAPYESGGDVPSAKSPASPGVSRKGIPVVATTADEPTRRDFLYIATGAAGAVGVALAAWPFIDQMNPSAAVLALSTAEFDISSVPVGQQVVLKWRGHPLFVRHRTSKEIAEARAVNVDELPDQDARNAALPDGTPASDLNRAQKAEWLVLVGVCTHLGCTPTVFEGDYGGWLCHCHGSQYDTSGRIRKGPAPQNLAVPPYSFTSPTKIKVG